MAQRMAPSSRTAIRHALHPILTRAFLLLRKESHHRSVPSPGLECGHSTLQECGRSSEYLRHPQETSVGQLSSHRLANENLALAHVDLVEAQMLMLSHFVPTFYFGMFTGLAILMGLFASLTTLPALFVLLKYPKLKAEISQH